MRSLLLVLLETEAISHVFIVNLVLNICEKVSILHLVESLVTVESCLRLAVRIVVQSE